MAFLCVSRSIVWSEEEAQNSHLFGDFKSLEEAQDFEAQFAISGSRNDKTIACISTCTETHAARFGAGCAVRIWPRFHGQSCKNVAVLAPLH